MNIFNIYADVDAISMTPSRNTRSYTLRSVPSSPWRSFLIKASKMHVARWIFSMAGFISFYLYFILLFHLLLSVLCFLWFCCLCCRFCMNLFPLLLLFYQFLSVLSVFICVFCFVVYVADFVWIRKQAFVKIVKLQRSEEKNNLL